MDINQNNNLNPVPQELANKDEIPLAVESINPQSTTTPIEPKPNFNTSSDNIFNQNLNVVKEPSFSQTPEPTPFQNPVEAKAFELQSNPNALASNTNPTIQVEKNGTKEKIIITIAVVSGVVLLGVGGFLAYNIFLTSNTQVAATPTAPVANTTPQPLLKDEYLLAVANIENSYMNSKNSLVSSFQNFSDTNNSQKLKDAADNISNSYNTLNDLNAPTDLVEFNEKLKANLLSLRYTFESLSGYFEIQDNSAINSLVPAINTLITEIDNNFKEIKQK